MGALEQFRNITNIVAVTITPGQGTNAPTTNAVAYWQTETDSGNQVAWYSSRGNVGIGTEGNYGRFKPDVVSPGTFVVSTRSRQWDTNAYYNPTNVQDHTLHSARLWPTNVLVYYNVTVPPNAVGVIITHHRPTSILPVRFRSTCRFMPSRRVFRRRTMAVMIL